eukprot:s608_g9.t1
MLLLKSKFCVQSAMEALRWLSLLLSELICLREIGTKLPSQLLRFEACSIFEVQEYLELFTASTADAAVRATMLAVLTEDRHGEMPWVCLAQSCSLLSALLVAEMGRLKRSASVHDLSVRHSRLLARAFGPLTQWPRLPDDLPHQVRCLQEMARKELLRRTSMQPGDAEDIFYAPLTWEALATDEDSDADDSAEGETPSSPMQATDDNAEGQTPPSPMKVALSPTTSARYRC